MIRLILRMREKIIRMKALDQEMDQAFERNMILQHENMTSEELELNLTRKLSLRLKKSTHMMRTAKRKLCVSEKKKLKLRSQKQ